MRRVRHYVLPGGAELPLRVDCPGIDGHEWWEIRSPKPGQSVQGVCLSARPWTTFIHYSQHEKEITPCWKSAGAACELCDTAERRFAGYLCLYEPQWRRRIIAPFTRFAYQHCQLLRSEPADLLLRTVTLSRGARGPRDKVSVRIGEVAEDVLDPCWYVTPSQIKAQMLHVWGIKEKGA